MKITSSLSLTLAVFAVAALPLSAQTTKAPAAAKDYWVYFGTYTGFKNVHNNKPNGKGESHSQGIYAARFNAATGELGQPILAAQIINPSFVTISPNHRFLYSVIEDPTSVGPPLDHESFVSAFAIDQATGKLRLLNTLPTSGTSTCFISMDHTGKFLLMANFGSGNFTVMRVKPDGSLGETTAAIQHIGHSVNPSIQNMPHPHSVLVSPDNKFVIVSDLGQDKIFVYNFDDKTGQLSPYEAPYASVLGGGGPRHFVFGADGKFGYQLSEMSGNVDVFAWDPSKTSLRQVQVKSTLPQGFNGGNHSAEIAVSPNGKFLYESNRRTHGPNDERGPDSIGVFAIDPQQGTLTEVQQADPGGIMPRSFGIDPTGNWLLSASELNNTVTVMKIDATTGKLTNTGKSIMVDTPVCIQFVPIR